MTARASRFEIVHGDDGWWARFRAANGRVVWVTETYRKSETAIRAVRTIQFGSRGIELREVDKRTQP